MVGKYLNYTKSNSYIYVYPTQVKAFNALSSFWREHLTLYIDISETLEFENSLKKLKQNYSIFLISILVIWEECSLNYVVNIWPKLLFLPDISKEKNWYSRNEYSEHKNLENQEE
uniref:Uncharacterized protein n=1 Tax=Strongyloides venezuelensis TaxID=75913 RepID=A0A0K0G5U3_STRVS